MHAVFTPTKVEAKENSEHWKELCEEPHLNQFGADKLFLHFHWDWKSALFESVDAVVTLYEDFPGIKAGTYNFKGLDQGKWDDGRAPMGAVRLASPFELLLPFSLKEAKGHFTVSRASQIVLSTELRSASPRAAFKTPPVQPSTGSGGNPNRSNTRASSGTAL
jgi:hypothetical protein